VRAGRFLLGVFPNFLPATISSLFNLIYNEFIHINVFSYSLIQISASINIRSLLPLFILALKRSGGWDIVVEWVSTPEPDSKRSRLERGLQIDPFSSFSVAASQLAESGG
jgi:hypothetical protein